MTFALLLKREQLSSDWLGDVSRLLHRRVKLFTFIFALSDFCEFGPILKTSPRKPLVDLAYAETFGTIFALQARKGGV